MDNRLTKILPTHHALYQQLFNPTATTTTYRNARFSAATQKAYVSDMVHFLQHGGPLPATPAMVEAYLNQYAAQYKPDTLKRRLVALRLWHHAHDAPDPTRHVSVVSTMQGITRTWGAPVQKAKALRLKHFKAVLAAIQTQPNTLLAYRDRALFLVGFFGSLRRSELVAIELEYVEFAEEGMVIVLRDTKGDRVKKGEPCTSPLGPDHCCPVRALLEWLRVSNITRGAVFRRVSKSGRVLMPRPHISGHHWNHLFKQYVAKAHLRTAERFSSHSLRGGFATEAARKGASLDAIQRHGRWKSTKVVVGYIEAGRQFADSAVHALFEF